MNGREREYTAEDLDELIREAQEFTAIPDYRKDPVALARRLLAEAERREREGVPMLEMPEPVRHASDPPGRQGELTAETALATGGGRAADTSQFPGTPVLLNPTAEVGRVQSAGDTAGAALVARLPATHAVAEAIGAFRARLCETPLPPKAEREFWLAAAETARVVLRSRAEYALQTAEQVNPLSWVVSDPSGGAPSAPTPAEVIRLVDAWRELRDADDPLPAQAFALAEFAGLSVNEVAAKLELPLQTARRKLAVARAALSPTVG